MSPSILITNDDGIQAEGIQVLSQKIYQAFGERMNIYILAPDHEQSAVSNAITMHRPLRIETVRFLHNHQLTAWAVNGTPTDCVKLAIETLLPEMPDLIISGINRGSNLGTDVLYSGTVAAATEGAILGVPSIAISLTEEKEPGYEVAADFICQFIPRILEHKLPEGTILNINVPPGHLNQIEGIRATKLGDRCYKNTFEERIDPRGRSYYWLAGDIVETDKDESYDVGAIKRNYISITPLRFDITGYNFLSSVEEITDDLHSFFQQESSSEASPEK